MIVLDVYALLKHEIAWLLLCYFVMMQLLVRFSKRSKILIFDFKTYKYWTPLLLPYSWLMFETFCFHAAKIIFLKLFKCFKLHVFVAIKTDQSWKSILYLILHLWYTFMFINILIFLNIDLFHL